jgi:predicted DCC family thiol-disulfide oxidoreductase YuxK
MPELYFRYRIAISTPPSTVMRMDAPPSPTASPIPEPPLERPVVLFDGVCNLCNGAVQFIVDHERAPELQFAPLQSERAEILLRRAFGAEKAKLLREGATGDGDPDTVVLVDGDRGFTHSTAALQIARRLRAPWRWLFGFVIVPRVFRDVVYRFIAKHRYRWFGRSETCRVPTPALRARFLE